MEQPESHTGSQAEAGAALLDARSITWVNFINDIFSGVVQKMDRDIDAL